jgi:hypothetical protein
MASTATFSVQGQASSISVEGLEETMLKLKRAERAERRAMSAAERQIADNAEWETEHMLAHPNSRLVLGTTHAATEADLALFAETGRHCHKVVCNIVCQDCGCTWTINKQDAFQTVRCASCQAKVAKAKETRKVERKSAAQLAEEIKVLKAQIALAKGELTEEQVGDLEVEVTEEQIAALKADIAAEQKHVAEMVAAA